MIGTFSCWDRGYPLRSLGDPKRAQPSPSVGTDATRRAPVWRKEPRSPTKRAFTHVELLVVIAILAAILFPVFAEAKLAAKNTSGLSQAEQIGTGMHIDVADYDEGSFRTA